MRWYRNLYMGPNAAHNIKRIRQRAEEGRWMPGIYYITPASIPGNLLDVFHNGMLFQPVFAKAQCTDVVGVAEGKQEALRLVQEIIKEIYDRTGSFDIRSYFREEDFMEEQEM